MAKEINWPPPPERDALHQHLGREAAKLRDRLDVIGRTTQREQKRAQVAQIKREAFELLHDADIPYKLRMLIVDLWGGTKGFLRRPDETRLTAAEIEGRHPVDLTGQRPSTLGKKRLGELLREELGVKTDFSKQIAAWRNDPDYWRRVFQYRPDYRWSPK